jgi:hypothetical protein
LNERWVAGGLGVLVLLVIVVVATGDDDEGQAQSQAAPTAEADAARDELAKLLGSKVPRSKAKGKDAGEGEDEGDDGADADASDPEAGEPSARGVQASVASVDALIAAREYEAARIILGPLLEADPKDAQLHWRMARVLTALRGFDNRIAALDSHAAAISIDGGLLDDEAFMAQLWALVDDPALRVAAVDVALEWLDTRADDRLVKWLNVQTKPLGHAVRQRIVAHLEAHDRSAAINRPLQRALDLWQAREADDPCEAFGAALRAAAESPDSFLVGTLHGVAIPQTAAGEGGDPQPCPGAAEQLAEVRAQHDEMFAGIDPVVPRAYRKRTVPKTSQDDRRKRRR